MFCTFYKWLISNTLDTTKPLSPLLRRHIQRCADCHNFYQASCILARRLTSEARQLYRTSPEDLVQHLLESLPAERPSPTSKTARLWPMAAAAALILGLALMTWLFYWRSSAVRHSQYQTAAAMVQSLLSPSSLSSDSASTSSLRWTDILEVPLRQEIQTLTSETHSALDFLVRCLPVGLQTQPQNGRPPKTAPRTSAPLKNGC